MILTGSQFNQPKPYNADGPVEEHPSVVRYRRLVELHSYAKGNGMQAASVEQAPVEPEDIDALHRRIDQLERGHS